MKDNSINLIAQEIEQLIQDRLENTFYTAKDQVRGSTVEEEDSIWKEFLCVNRKIIIKILEER